jgi:hypothetical protein
MFSRKLAVSAVAFILGAAPAAASASGILYYSPTDGSAVSLSLDTGLTSDDMTTLQQVGADPGAGRIITLDPQESPSADVGQPPTSDGTKLRG